MQFYQTIAQSSLCSVVMVICWQAHGVGNKPDYATGQVSRSRMTRSVVFQPRSYRWLRPKADMFFSSAAVNATRSSTEGAGILSKTKAVALSKKAPMARRTHRGRFCHQEDQAY